MLVVDARALGVVLYAVWRCVCGLHVGLSVQYAVMILPWATEAQTPPSIPWKGRDGEGGISPPHISLLLLLWIPATGRRDKERLSLRFTEPLTQLWAGELRGGLTGDRLQKETIAQVKRASHPSSLLVD